MPRRRRFRPNLPLWAAWALFLGLIVAYIGLGTLATMMMPSRPGFPKSPYLVFLARSLDATLAVWFFAVGSSIGSFLNVVAYRLPRGRTLGGHSACPFCCTTIAARDNIPVFAWLALRGRCRTCRLPISIQYPLVELAVGLMFLVMYFVEFGIAGSNMPGSIPRPMGIGLVWMSVSQTLVVRVLLFLFLLSGLVAVALIVIRRSFPPLSLFACLILILAIGQLAQPDAVVMLWQGVMPSTSSAGWVSPAAAKVSPFDIMATLFCGSLAGFFAAALTLPWLGSASNRAAWIGVSVCAGALFGWQSVASICLVILVAALAGGTITSRLFQLAPTDSGFCTLYDPAIWAWLGVVVYRANWKSSDQLLRSVPVIADWGAYLLPLGLAMPLAWLVGRLGSASAALGLACAAEKAALLENAEDSVAAEVVSEVSGAGDL